MGTPASIDFTEVKRKTWIYILSANDGLRGISVTASDSNSDILAKLRSMCLTPRTKKSIAFLEKLWNILLMKAYVVGRVRLDPVRSHDD